MASASLSSCVYDVFLSFRGEDTRKTFADHLYHALIDSGVHTFRDVDVIKFGEGLSPIILNGIEQSNIGMPILSENFANSSWCLKEVAKMVDLNKTIIPIFYYIDPSDVRHQSGKFGEAFAEHDQKRYDESTVTMWRAALKKVADLKGYDIRNTEDGYEAKVIKLIVKDIIERVCRPCPMILPDKLVQMNDQVDEMLKLMDIDHIEDVRIIGVVGRRDSGKTTLVKVIYNQVMSRFDEACFVADIKEGARQPIYGLVALQKQLLKGMIDFHTVDEGCQFMSRRFSHGRVLFVLDDVDHKKQLQALAGNTSWFGLGSRIIVTTRHEHVLINHGVLKKFIFHPTVSSEFQAITSYNHVLPEEHKDLIEKLMGSTLAESLPLALEVILSNLFTSYNFGNKDWEEEIHQYYYLLNNLKSLSSPPPPPSVSPSSSNLSSGTPQQLESTPPPPPPPPQQQQQQQEQQHQQQEDPPQPPSAALDYYEVLGIALTATEPDIKKAYYIKAREVHPDKNTDDPHAKEKFQTLGEAYQVLSNRGLRKSYDRVGRFRISEDIILNPLKIFNTLFGGGLLFEDYVGEFLIAESMSLPEASNEGETLGRRQTLLDFQKDREKLLAKKLKERLNLYIEGGDRKGYDFKDFAKAEASKLSKTDHGFEILRTIGVVYVRQAERANEKNLIGSLVGATGDWLEQVRSHTGAAQGANAVIQMQRQIERGELTGDMEKFKNEMIRSFWMINHVDMKTTLTHVCQMVLEDKTATRALTSARADGLWILGEVFMHYRCSMANTTGGQPQYE